MSLRICRFAVKNPFAPVPASKTGLRESARTCLGIVTSRKRGIEENRMRPPRRTGATCQPRRPCTGTCFNPRPPRRAGATSIHRPHSPHHRFNPRPPRRAGATCRPMAFSILARPEGRALPAWARSVSILARPEGRALPRSNSSWSCRLFQSSPAPKDGRYSTTSPRPENNCFSLSFREPIGNSFRLIRNNMIRFIQVIET